LAAKEIIRLNKKITSADIRIQVAEKELENRKKQTEHTREVELLLKDKFDNSERYQRMKEQFFCRVQAELQPGLRHGQES
jgi:hypothetical protein